ncbi:hypothetical protein Hamer_G011402, partial [Homarus americanus]
RCGRCLDAQPGSFLSLAPVKIFSTPPTPRLVPVVPGNIVPRLMTSVTGQCDGAGNNVPHLMTSMTGQEVWERTNKTRGVAVIRPDNITRRSCRIGISLVERRLVRCDY